MTRKELREEIVARGFDNILGEEGGEARINRWIDQVVREICDFKPWPFLFTSKEGAPPLKVEDLGHVEAAVDKTNDRPLRYATVAQISRFDSDLEASGNPECWFTEDNVTVKVYPGNTAITLWVHYRKVSAAMTKDADEPPIPSAYHDLIVDGVVAKAYKMTDNYAASGETRKEFERGLAGMAHALLHPNYDGDRRIARTGTSVDYL